MFPFQANNHNTVCVCGEREGVCVCVCEEREGVCVCVEREGGGGGGGGGRP